MKKILWTLLFVGVLLATQTGLALAQPSTITTATPTLEATDSAEATDSSSLATPSAAVQQRIQERKDSDITETSGQQKSKLAAYLEQNPPGPLSWNNFLQHLVTNAVEQGVPANIIVLVLLFPLIASFIATSRHIIGLRGFGIYIPAVLSVAIVSTGVFLGLMIFLAIVTTALVTKKLIKPAQLSYLPRTALLLWTVSVGLLGMLLLAPFVNLVNLMSVNIFPILILVLLAENFLDALARTKPADAVALTVETMVLAFISSFVLQWEALQKFALVEPELLLTAVLFLNLAVGKFTGLRVSELLRFRSIIEEEQ